MAATDFFTAEVLTWKGPITYYVLFFIHLETRRICVSGITRHPDQEWMEQQARAVTLEEWGFLAKHKYLLQDRDAKFCTSFRQLIETDGRKTIVLPARSPNLNAYAERWVRSVKEECLSRFILFGERSLRRALQQYSAHYHEERNHQGRQNLLLFLRPSAGACKAEGTIRCRERLGGLLKFYDRQAA
jgi:transposase InsO family protein